MMYNLLYIDIYILYIDIKLNLLKCICHITLPFLAHIMIWDQALIFTSHSTHHAQWSSYLYVLNLLLIMLQNAVTECTLSVVLVEYFLTICSGLWGGHTSRPLDVCESVKTKCYEDNTLYRQVLSRNIHKICQKYTFKMCKTLAWP